MKKNPVKLCGVAALSALLACGGGQTEGKSAAVVAPPAPKPTASAPAAAAPKAEEIDEKALMAHVTALVAMHGRGSATEDELQAARYVDGELENEGIGAVDGAARIQPFSAGEHESRNVYGMLRGAANDGPVIVLGTHIDHLGTKGADVFPGAEDNASGVAAVLEIARALRRSEHPHKATILFSFFGSEEIKLLGSHHFVEHPPVPLERVKAMINIDMIGRPLADKKGLAQAKVEFGIKDSVNSVGVVGMEGRPLFRDAVKKACDAVAIRPVGPEDFPPPVAMILRKITAGRGDNAPFEEKGIPTLFFGSGESDDYHKKTDTIDKVNPAIMSKRARAILRTVEALADAPLEASAEAPHP